MWNNALQSYKNRLILKKCLNTFKKLLIAIDKSENLKLNI